MLFNVPQFIDIEDKIVGPLTAKQLGWLVLGGIVLLVLYNFLDNQAFIISIFIVGGIFGALAFYKPYGQPLITFIINSISFGFRPRVYIWRRLADTAKAHHQAAKTETTHREKKTIDEEKVREISEMLEIRKK